MQPQRPIHDSDPLRALRVLRRRSEIRHDGERAQSLESGLRGTDEATSRSRGDGVKQLS